MKKLSIIFGCVLFSWNASSQGISPFALSNTEGYNASCNHSAKKSMNNVLENIGIMEFDDMNLVVIPVIAENPLTLGSISWVMNFPESGIQIQEIRMNTDKGMTVYKVLDHQLRLAWFSLDPLFIAVDDTLFFIKCSFSMNYMKEIISPVFVLMDESAFSDENGLELLQTAFRYPSLKYTGSVNEFYISAAYPNPFSSQTHFTIGFPGNAALNFIVYDLAGREIYGTETGLLQEGLHTLTLDATTIRQGSYFYRIEAKTESGNLLSTGRFVIAK